MVTEIISALLQILVFSAIPFVFFVISRRKIGGFFEFIGFTAPTSKAVYLAVAASLIFLAGGISLVFLSNEVREIMINPPSITGKIRSIGLSPASVAIVAFVI